MNQVSDLMTRNTVSVSPEMPIMEAVQILSRYKLDGAPVINSDRVVVGILTEYDLLTKGTSIHLPTLLKLFNEFDLYKKDKSSIREELTGILSMRVQDVMNPKPFVMKQSASIEEATKTFTEHHRINPIIVIDDLGKLVGVLSRYDVIRLYSAGASSAPSSSFNLERKLDDRIDNFLNSFEHEFLFISKERTRGWLLFTLITGSIFAIIGFIVAVATLIRITF